MDVTSKITDERQRNDEFRLLAPAYAASKKADARTLQPRSPMMMLDKWELREGGQ